MISFLKGCSGPASIQSHLDLDGLYFEESSFVPKHLQRLMDKVNCYNIQGLNMEKAVEIAAEAEKRLAGIFGNKLVKVMLYGSYAQNQHDYASDIDILALVLEYEKNISTSRDEIADIVAELSSKYDIFVSIIVKDENLFHKRAEYVPFYMNAKNKGINLHG